MDLWWFGVRIEERTRGNPKWVREGEREKGEMFDESN